MTKTIGKQIQSGVGQLTMVEHALCPLDARMSLTSDLVHETSFSYTDQHKKRRTGRVRVCCPLGLLPQDELFVWGLLALTLADEQNGGELHATRHYLLRHLGLIDEKSRRGGRQYSRLSEAIDRLAAVRYFNDGFYDPIRSEHRKVSFGFFSYSQPSDDDSTRAWRIIWDPLFFEFAKAARGALRFDLTTYRQLDVASRRLYLFARKILFRKDISHAISVDHIATNVLGYAADLPPFEQNVRVRRCLARLVAAGILRKGDSRLYKRTKNVYSLVMARGPHLLNSNTKSLVESPQLEPLLELGFQPLEAKRLLAKYPTPLLREWIDITLTARDRFGLSFFKRSPAAYLSFYLDRAAKGQDGPPDWWHEVRKAEEREHAKRARQQQANVVDRSSVPQKAMTSLENVRADIFRHFLAAGQSEIQAKQNARRFRQAAEKTKA
ncbi:MAG: hypothetical protein KDA87_00550 [Planctomycetales bacterium]|nr:hypothetical protein [Planctomycetales bacterium]